MLSWTTTPAAARPGRRRTGWLRNALRIPRLASPRLRWSVQAHSGDAD